ncbi:phage tail assembly chaperone [Escherichia coli]|uniref:phage tail assembly chaperone n=1 Tax=Escherichia coli TaxID=562 RepID=UPI0039A6FB69
MAKDLKTLALARLSGFRHKTVKVPEWRNVSVVLREPSAEAWYLCRKCSMVMERMTIPCRWWRKPAVNLEADVTLFCDVLL